MAETGTLSNWTLDALEDLSDKTYLITGANSGIGYQAASALRRAHANVIVGARSPEKGEAAVRTIRTLPGSGSVELLGIDLADLDAIRAADTHLRELTDGLDAVVNNAGIMETPQQQTKDGFELQFGTNHLGHFLLNHLVFDLVSARSGRIVPVSSIVHLRARPIDFDDPMLTEHYTPARAYAQSKLANLMYGLELARRLERAGSPVMSVSAHAGWSATNLFSTGPTGLARSVYKVVNWAIAQPAEAGAVPEVLAAAGKEARNGAYYGPTSFGGMRGPVGDARIAEQARDEEAASRLWALSEELLGITFDLGG